MRINKFGFMVIAAATVGLIACNSGNGQSNSGIKGSGKNGDLKLSALMLFQWVAQA
jgi:hypothetical protein